MDRDRVAEWQQLMLEWEAALERYEEAEKGRLATHPNEVSQDSASSESALRRLMEIKGRVDRLISESRRLRNEERDHVIIGTLESMQHRLDSIKLRVPLTEAPPADPEKLS